MNGVRTVCGIESNKFGSHDNLLSNIFISCGEIRHNTFGFAVKNDIKAVIFIAIIFDTMFEPPLPKFNGPIAEDA